MHLHGVTQRLVFLNTVCFGSGSEFTMRFKHPDPGYDPFY